MARVTVEDCIYKVSNRFDLVLLAAERAREISGGAELTIDRDRDKNPVVALREIAEETVRPEHLKEGLVQSLQKVQVDEDEEVDERRNDPRRRVGKSHATRSGHRRAIREVRRPCRHLSLATGSRRSTGWLWG